MSDESAKSATPETIVEIKVTVFMTQEDKSTIVAIAVLDEDGNYVRTAVRPEFLDDTTGEWGKKLLDGNGIIVSAIDRALAVEGIMERLPPLWGLVEIPAYRFDTFTKFHK